MSNCPHCGAPLEDRRGEDSPMPCPAPHARRRRMIPLFVIPFVLLAAVTVLAVILFLTRDPTTEVSTHPLFSEGLLPAAVTVPDETGQLRERWGYINTAGKYAIEPAFDAAGTFATCGLAPVRQNALWGYIDRQGEMVIPAAFAAALPFGDTTRLAAVKVGELWGYINEKGRMMVNPQFEEAGPFDGSGMALVKKAGKYGFINAKGVYTVPPQYEDARPFGEGRVAPVFTLGQWGCIDRSGRYAVNPQFDSIEPFAENGLALVGIGGKYGFIDEYGAYAVAPQYTYAESFAACGLALVAFEGRYSYIDGKGRTVIAGDFVAARSFGDNDLAAVAIRSPGDEAAPRWGFIDREGRFAIAAAYQWVADFSRAFAGVKMPDGRFAYIGANGEPFLTFSENCIGVSIFFADDYAFIKERQENGAAVYRLVNRRGSISEECWQQIYPFAVETGEPF